MKYFLKNNKSVSEPNKLANKSVENNQKLPSTDLINKDDKVSSKSFEESRLYFIEKLSKTEIGSNNNVTKTTRTPSLTETQNTCNNNLNIKPILNNRSISPRAEAIEMEKLWATSNNNNNNNNKFERNEGYYTIYESKNSLNCKKQSNEKITATYDMLTPGSPPTYMSTSNNSKLNIRSQSESGYMADTEDIQQHQQQQLQIYALSQNDNTITNKGENVSDIVQKFESEKLNSKVRVIENRFYLNYFLKILLEMGKPIQGVAKMICKNLRERTTSAKKFFLFRPFLCMGYINNIVMKNFSKI